MAKPILLGDVVLEAARSGHAWPEEPWVGQPIGSSTPPRDRRVLRERVEVHVDSKYGGIRADVYVGGKLQMSCDVTTLRAYTNECRRALAAAYRMQKTPAGGERSGG